MSRRESRRRVLRRQERIERFGIDCVSSLTWRNWGVGGEYSKPLVLKNLGSRVQTLVYEIPKTKYFYLSFPIPIKLSPGVSRSIEVRFRPIHFVGYEDYLKLVIDDKHTFYVRIRAILPRLKFDFPRKLDFEFCPIREFTRYEVPLRNIGEVDLSFSFRLPKLKSPNQRIFQLDPMSATVPIGEEIRVLVSFGPSLANPFAMKSFLIVRAVGSEVRGETSDVVVPFVVSGIGKFPFLSFPKTIQFESVASVEGRQVQEIVVRNPSIVRARFVVSGVFDIFQFAPKQAVVPPRETLSVKVAYSPKYLNRTESEVFSINGKRVQCIGKNSGPTVQLDSEFVNFGDVFFKRTGGLHGRQIVTMINRSDQPAIVTVMNPTRVFRLTKSMFRMAPQTRVEFVIEFYPIHTLNFFYVLEFCVKDKERISLPCFGSAYDDTRNLRPHPLSWKLVQRKERTKLVEISPKHLYFSTNEGYQMLAVRNLINKKVAVRIGCRKPFVCFPPTQDVNPNQTTTFRIGYRPINHDTIGDNGMLDVAAFPKEQRSFRLVTEESFILPMIVPIVLYGRIQSLRQFLTNQLLIPNALPFGDTKIGQDNIQTFALSNTGPVGVFCRFEFELDWLTISPMQFWIPKEESFFCLCSFHPRASGAYSASVRLTINEEEVKTVRVAGKGIRPALEMDPAVSVLHIRQLKRSLTLMNPFMVSMDCSLSCRGRGFAINQEECHLPPCGEQEILVTYDGVGRQGKGRLSVQYGNERKSVRLLGHHVEKEKLLFSETKMDFGKCLLRSKQKRSLYIENRTPSEQIVEFPSTRELWIEPRDKRIRGQTRRQFFVYFRPLKEETYELETGHLTIAGEGTIPMVNLIDVISADQHKLYYMPFVREFNEALSVSEENVGIDPVVDVSGYMDMNESAVSLTVRSKVRLLIQSLDLPCDFYVLETLRAEEEECMKISPKKGHLEPHETVVVELQWNVFRDDFSFVFGLELGHNVVVSCTKQSSYYLSRTPIGRTSYQSIYLAKDDPPWVPEDDPDDDPDSVLHVIAYDESSRKLSLLYNPKVQDDHSVVSNRTIDVHAIEGSVSFEYPNFSLFPMSTVSSLQVVMLGEKLLPREEIEQVIVLRNPSTEWELGYSFVDVPSCCDLSSREGVVRKGDTSTVFLTFRVSSICPEEVDEELILERLLLTYWNHSEQVVQATHRERYLRLLQTVDEDEEVDRLAGLETTGHSIAKTYEEEILIVGRILFECGDRDRPDRSRFDGVGFPVGGEPLGRGNMAIDKELLTSVMQDIFLKVLPEEPRDQKDTFYCLFGSHADQQHAKDEAQAQDSEPKTTTDFTNDDRISQEVPSHWQCSLVGEVLEELVRSILFSE